MKLLLRRTLVRSEKDGTIKTVPKKTDKKIVHLIQQYQYGQKDCKRQQSYKNYFIQTI